MANHAVQPQVPIMVRKPKAVWPGLAKMGMYQKEIAGDGNCLFASLSDQLYGSPIKHPEIRSSIIEHMRTYRPLFEHYVHKDDVQQRRALRASTLAARNIVVDDDFEEYLTLMSRSGTYGGEPELVAFCQVYDQDVIVHLPTIQNYDRDSISYKNEQRLVETSPQPLHICYGGDEVTRAHYDSARSRDGITYKVHDSPLTDRRRSLQKETSGSQSRNSSEHLSIQVLRRGSTELSSEKIHEFLQKGRKDIEGSFEQLNDKGRVRSPSISSSRRSSSSKRSLEDDDVHGRATKKADRRKSMKKRIDSLVPSTDQGGEISFRLRIESPGPGTPASTQDTEYSSDPADPAGTTSPDGEYHDEGNAEDRSDSDASLDRAMKAMKAHPRSRKGWAIVTQRLDSAARMDVAGTPESRRSSIRQ